MRISFIGMSGSGKSYWSAKLAQLGYKIYCCDDLIEKKLDKELKERGYKGIEEVARWMGQPYETRYITNSQKYLRFEKEVVEEILGILEKGDPTDDIVIDTTGSIIYIADSLLEKLRILSKIVYLEVPQSVQDKMYALYLKEPKPVIWGDIFSKSADEDEMAALGRNYPELLKSRSIKYSAVAEKVLEYEFHNDKRINTQLFIEGVNK